MPTNIREAAYKLLARIEKEKKFAALALDAEVERGSYSDEERAFLTALTYGTVERRLSLDHLISHYTGKAIGRLDLPVVILLRLGMYQILWLDRIPDSAAVNETVKLAARYAARTKGLINAILRRTVREKDDLPFPAGNSPEALSVRHSIPLWILQSWQKDYPDKLEALCDAVNVTAPLTLRVNTLKTTRDALGESLPCKWEGIDGLANAIRLTENCPVSSLTALSTGECFVQDAASQMAALILDAKPGLEVADVCACPGGKSFSIALSMENQGKVHSFDLHESKLPLITDGAKRLGIDIIEAKAHDSSNTLPELVGKMDRVLCDVPCSGLGVLSKKSDLRYKEKTSVEALPPRQAAILAASAPYVKVGGVLVYSTCTLRRAENEDVVTGFLAAHPEFETVTIDACGHVAQDGMLTLFPNGKGSDGFFIAKMRRVR
ncbi:MAG: 16S rRNA (cytosine(967)-C(5))-methyltransferase RsmB [Clostridia bacterium]|nr:16S rRNA (cytosine(967)-C(5))-methyltransferase RsmB [Clostridia bacterium]